MSARFGVDDLNVKEGLPAGGWGVVGLDCWNLEYWGRLSFLGWIWFARDELGR